MYMRKTRSAILKIAVFLIPGSGVLHTLFQTNLWLIAEIFTRAFYIVDTTVGQEFDTATRQRGVLALKTRDESKNVRGQIGCPERNTTGGQFFAKRVSDGGRKLMEADWMIAS